MKRLSKKVIIIIYLSWKGNNKTVLMFIFGTELQRRAQLTGKVVRRRRRRAESAELCRNDAAEIIKGEKVNLVISGAASDR